MAEPATQPRQRPAAARAVAHGSIHVSMLVAIALCLAATGAGAAEPPRPIPPSPYDILDRRLLETPTLDGVDLCIPVGLPDAYESFVALLERREWQQALEIVEAHLGEVDEVPAEAALLIASVQARVASEREEMLVARDALQRALRRSAPRRSRACGRLEMARLALLLGRYPESAAQCTMAERLLEDLVGVDGRFEEAKFYRTEGLYRTDRAFEAHLGFRRLARSANARLAAGARLRLTDLSFEAGKSERARMEYEALLPRAEAFGASLMGWALRVAEAAMDDGDYEGALAWMERYLEATTNRDAFDLVTIRRADVEYLRGDERKARELLDLVSERRGRHAPGLIASVRQVDLRLEPGTGDKRVETVLAAASSSLRAVRLYALGVLVSELLRQGDIDGALAAGTRLAYEGYDRVLTPNFRRDLDEMLARATSAPRTEDACLAVTLRLGGRYSILMDRAREPDPFLALGGCLEILEMPWLAIDVYRRLTRTFGAEAAGAVALPLARVSLNAEDYAMVRAAAHASLAREAEAEVEHASEWRLLLAEAELRDGQPAEAAKLLQGLLEQADMGGIERRRLHATLLYAEAVSVIGSDEESRALLVTSLSKVPREARSRWPLVHGEASLLTAEAHRDAGDVDRARALYRSAAEELPSGAMASEAGYWLGALGPDAEMLADIEAGRAGRGDVWHEALGMEEAGPWRSLAQLESDLDPLRRAYLPSTRFARGVLPAKQAADR